MAWTLSDFTFSSRNIHVWNAKSIVHKQNANRRDGPMTLRHMFWHCNSNLFIVVLAALLIFCCISSASCTLYPHRSLGIWRNGHCALDCCPAARTACKGSRGGPAAVEPVSAGQKDNQYFACNAKVKRIFRIYGLCVLCFKRINHSHECMVLHMHAGWCV